MSSDTAAPVAVVVVTWNSAPFLDGCLGSLRRLERPAGEVVVVDGGSTDGTLDLVRERFPEVAIVACGENIGFCRANNLGIARTRSPFVLVLNPDTRLTPRFLEELLPAFEDPRVGIVSGKLLRFDGCTLDSAGQRISRSRKPVDRGYGRQDRGQFDRDEEVFGACGAAALYRRTMVDAVADEGGRFFDEAFFAFYEDLDVAWRAGRLGWKAAYRHRAVGYHLRGGTAGRATVSVRGRALLARSAEIRFHATKNRYLAILRNDSPRSYLRDLPFILARDVGTLAILLVSSPSVLGRLWRERALFAAALRRRRLDERRIGHHVEGETGSDGLARRARRRAGGGR